MKAVTINIPEPYLRAIDDLVRRKVFPNRAEAIRVAIRDLIRFHAEYTPGLPLHVWEAEKSEG